MKIQHSPVRRFVGLSLLAGFAFLGSSAVHAQQAQCASGTCPRAATAGYGYSYSSGNQYTYARSSVAQQTYSYAYAPQTTVAAQPAATAYRYQYAYQAQPVNTTQYRYQYAYQTAAATPYQYQAAAPVAAQPVQQAAATVQYQSYYYQSGTSATYQTQVTTTGGGDAYGFLGWLNATRASYGLSPVGYDANLESWAASNNAQQQSRGLGHYVMGSARRQNSAMGAYSSIGSMWMNSAAHRAALLDPSIRSIGIAGSGSYWTFNAN